MNIKENKSRFFNIATLKTAGILLMILLAVVLLWHGNATSNQAQTALVAQVYFDGEYRIADGAWQEIVRGAHIPSTQGDVTLRGNFHMLTCDGEYIGICSSDIPVALRSLLSLHLRFFLPWSFHGFVPSRKSAPCKKTPRKKKELIFLRLLRKLF